MILKTSGAVNGVINSYEKDGFNTSAFGMSLENSVYRSIGSMAGALGGDLFKISQGADFQKGSFGFTVLDEDDDGKNGFLHLDNEDMIKLGNMVGDITRQGVNWALGAQEGITFNLLNLQDFGLDMDLGLLEYTVGGSNSGLSIGSGGTNISNSYMDSMIKGFNLAKEHKKLRDGVASGDSSAKERYDLYVKLQLARYTKKYGYDDLSEEQKKKLDETIEMLEDAVNGNEDVSIEYSENGESSRDDNVITLDSSLETEINYDNGSITSNLNLQAQSVAKIGHEMWHDGENNVTDEQAQYTQDLISQNPEISEEELLQKLKEKYGDKAYDILNNYNEDIGAHGFEASIWGTFMKLFGVQNTELNAKYTYYSYGEGNDFRNFLNEFYNLGTENDYLDVLTKDFTEEEQKAIDKAVDKRKLAFVIHLKKYSKKQYSKQREKLIKKYKKKYQDKTIEEIEDLVTQEMTKKQKIFITSNYSYLDVLEEYGDSL